MQKSYTTSHTPCIYNVCTTGQDIAAASTKLTMGVVWQLMRADVLRFLSTVQVDALVVVYTMCICTYAPFGGTYLYYF